METVITATAATMIKRKEPLKFRHEYKHRINRVDDYILVERLNKIFKHDTHADSHGIYRVSSLYFETPEDKALRQKIDGVNRREKFRLRYYDDDLSFLLLEKKMKINGLCAKQSVRLSKEQAAFILKGEIDFLCKCDEPLLVELYSKMKSQRLSPKTIVSYDREAYVFEPGNVRITIDRNLKSSLGSTDFFDTNRALTDVSDGVSVLEIKYDNFLSDIVKMAIQLPGRRASEFSKYAVCRRYD